MAKALTTVEAPKAPPPAPLPPFWAVVAQHATAERVKEVLDQLHQMAKSGDLAAIRLYLDIARGEPQVGVW